MTAPNAPVLSAPHRHVLVVSSGIAPAVIERRGYRTVEKKQELKDLGFGQNQQKVPAHGGLHALRRRDRDRPGALGRGVPRRILRQCQRPDGAPSRGTSLGPLCFS
jgi:hypothetical protein